MRPTAQPHAIHFPHQRTRAWLAPAHWPLLIAGGLLAASAQAGLIGDSVQGSLVDQSGGIVSPQFASPAIVGAGTEFSGVWSDARINESWRVAVDVHDLSFTVSVQDAINPAHFFGGYTFFGLRLGDLDPGGRIVGVTVLSSDGGVQSIGFTDHGVTLQWNIFDFHDANGHRLDHGSWTFGLQVAVPEPSSWALLVAGLGVVGALARRRSR